MSKIFRKLRGINDQQLSNGLNGLAHGLGYHARIINHHGRVILWLVAYVVIDAALHIFAQWGW